MHDRYVVLFCFFAVDYKCCFCVCPFAHCSLGANIISFSTNALTMVEKEYKHALDIFMCNRLMLKLRESIAEIICE